MAEKRPTLKPGELPSITDTDSPGMHPATVVSDGYVGVDETKVTKAELAALRARDFPPNIYTPPPESKHETKAHERDHRTTGHVGPDRA